MTIDPAHHASGGLRRAPTAHEYESDIDLDEDEFLPSTSAAPGFDEDHVKAKFDQDIEDARGLSIRLLNPSLSEKAKKEHQMDFVTSRLEEWKKSTWEGQNFLHHLAYYDYRHDFKRKPSISLQWLMARAILRLPPHLMGSMDSMKRTPLTAALLSRNDMFSHSVCKNMKPETRQRFKAPLLSECDFTGSDREPTCLHAALTSVFDKEESRPMIIKTLCSFVPEKMFSTTDSKGRTPLHLAVEYERGCKTQVSVVEDLLHWGPAALEIQIQATSGSNRTLSVYQYHQYSRKRAEARRKAEIQYRRPAQPGNQEANGGAQRKSDQDQEKWIDRKQEAKKLTSKGEKSTSDKTSMGPPPLPKEKGDPSLKRRSSIAATPQDTVTPVQSPALTPVGYAKTGAIPTTSARPDTADVLAQKERLKEKERDEAAAEISKLLKLLYLRTQGPENAASCLHLQGETSKELWFDFGPPKKLSRADFRKHFSHLRFDKALQYVAFPQIELEGNGEPPDVRHQGKEDMTFFFEWLGQRGVSRIIKVIVDDLKAPSHSDEAIERALIPFDVEILDWRRLDLDPISLSKIGTHLREVYLQWSGRNSVLRSWSEKEGLALIPTLEVIHLIQHEGLESSERTQQNLDAFEARLHQSWPAGRPKPTVNRPKTGGGRRIVRGEAIETQPNRPERSVDPHKWIQCMENFAEHFRQIPALRDRITDPSLQPVEVALIDDGADITRPDLSDTKGGKFPGKSFNYYQEGSTWRVSPYWDSSSGHGTLMARLIHKICPSAVIHVIKLQTFSVENSKKLQINPDSAVKAIDYAAERGSQIICMSWTIKPPTGDKKKQFDDAIHNAINNQGVLLFCAASDQGKSADLTYPHGSNHASFRIGAAKATGSMLDTVGDAHELDFIFPGHQVVMDRGGDGYDTDLQMFDAHSGSSVANALAAGLAALIIECVRLGVFYTNEAKQLDPSIAIRKDDLIKIRDRNQMKYALSWIGTNRNTDNKYIEVWDTFNAVAENLRQNEGSRIDQLDKIATLARYFLKKGVN